MGVQQSTLRISLLDDVTVGARRITSALNGLKAQSVSSFAPIHGLIGQAVALGAGYLGLSKGFDATAGAAMEFETAFADVKKVVNASDEQFDNMRRSIRRMSTELPLAANDIAALFAAAGESGIATEDLQSFAEMAARVGIAFDMTAGQAGESLAKLKTQLHLSVAETGSFADAINYLSNNMASKAKDITDFMLRIGAFGEMGGFAKEELAAMGSAMIAAGSDASTAATAMNNVIRALTKGEFATKGQRQVAKAIGLDMPTLGKQMQKDAKGTLRKVLQTIAKQPKEKQVSLLSQFFGDEARAFMPLVGNIQLLDDAFASVADRTKYAGSAFKEYIQRASTTQNVLELLGNKVSNIFSEIGDGMLPTIRAAAIGIGDVIDTLGSRVTVFDQLKTSIEGFAAGFGYTGGMKEFMHDLGDILAGPIDPGAGDRLGRIFMQAKEWGASIRDLTDAINNSPIMHFFAQLSGYGFQLFLWGAGIAMLAGTIRKLAAAMMLLSGASTVLSVLKTLGTLAEFPGLGGGSAGEGAGAKPPKGGNGPSGVIPWLGKVGQWLKGFGTMAAFGTSVQALGDTPGDTMAEMVKNQEEYRQAWIKMLGIEDPRGRPDQQAGLADRTSAQFAIDAARRAQAAGMGGGSTDLNPGKVADDLGIYTVRIDSSSIAAMVNPQGVQDVRVTNQQPVNVNVNASIVNNGVSDPKAAADATVNAIGSQVKNAVESALSD